MLIKQNLILIILIGVILLGDMALGQDFSLTPSMSSQDPSIDRGSYYCIDIRTFILQDCHFTLTLRRGPNSGGHEHSPDSRPIGGLRFEGGLGGGTTFLPFDSRGGVVGVEIVIPEVSGGLIFNAANTPPQGYNCVFGCFEERSGLVEVQGLVRLEDTGLHHFVLRGGTDTHPQGTYGDTISIAILKEVAMEYFERTKRKLSVNDISLPKGGLFDWKATWAPPHSTHRIGNDADINTKDGGGVFTKCVDDKKLKAAVAEAGSGGIPVLVCEDEDGRPVPPDDPSGVFKHIDFD